jgi:hypothetical protein
MTPTREEAENILAWAGGRNPGAWVPRSKAVARTAETIANKCMRNHAEIERLAKDGSRAAWDSGDAQTAYVSGLLHDIGRYEGVSGLRHIYAGYELLKRKGFDETAGICLSHSFPYQNIGEYFGKNDCAPEETAAIESFLAHRKYDDFDRLIQLCDAIGTAEGVSLIEVRVMDVIRRHGFNEYTLNKIEAIFGLKAYFDALCGTNIYDLFDDEIRDVRFRT